MFAANEAIGCAVDMKVQNAGLYKRISFFVEIIFGLLLLLNGVILIVNYFGLTSFQEKFANFFNLESLLSKSAHEWRFLVEFTHTMIVAHLSAFVMVCIGIVVLAAAIHTKKSL
jgi:ABC-type Fe3+ transport system permease subunit